MFKMIAIAIVLLVAAVLIFATTRPDTLRVERSASVKASPEEVFALISDFQRWGAWSPWEKKDPELKRTFSGAERGTGAIYAWKGNSDVGEGRMEIITAVPNSRVVLNLDFIKPFKVHNVVEFTLTPEGTESDSTNITWSMQGPMPYVSKLMSVFVNMDKMIGKDFETGLANLKSVAEK